MPGAEQAEDFRAEGNGKQPVHLVQPPHDRAFDGAEHVAAQKAFQVRARSARRVPVVHRVGVQVELIGQALGEGFVQRVSGSEVSGAQGLEVGRNDLCACLARLLQAARQQAGLAHLPRAFHEHDAVLPCDGRAELVVGRADQGHVRQCQHCVIGAGDSRPDKGDRASGAFE